MYPVRFYLLMNWLFESVGQFQVEHIYLLVITCCSIIQCSNQNSVSDHSCPIWEGEGIWFLLIMTAMSVRTWSLRKALSLQAAVGSFQTID